MNLLRNPAWVDKALKQNWAKLEAAVGSKWMPIANDKNAIISERKARIERGEAEGVYDKAGYLDKKHITTFQEYGTGHYGTVLPLRDPHVVLKISSDPSEAHFVAYATKLGSFPDGLVKYFRIIELPGSFRGRSIFAIWREAAHDVGLFAAMSYRGMFEKIADVLGSDPHSIRTSRDLLYRFKVAGHEVREWLRKHPSDASRLKQAADNIDYDDTAEYISDGKISARFRGFHKVALYFSALEGLTEMMENTNGLHYVGGALRFYLERGVLLADVHANNVGLVDRPGHHGPMAVITDPGHAVFLQSPQQAAAVANRGRRR